MALALPSSRPRRVARPLAVVVVVALGLALAACGGDDPEGGGRSGGGGGTSGGDDGVVQVEHRYGTTTIESVPERIVSLDPQWTDVLLALGVTPVGYITSPLQEDPTFPWQGDALAGSEPLTYVDALPFDAVANLHPDLILVTYAAPSESDYSLLSETAPTIASLTDAEVETWEALTEVVGRVLHREDDAAALVEETHAAIQAVPDDLPGLEGRTIAFANYVPGSSLVVLADPDDGAGILFGQLGLGIAPGIAAEGGDATGRVEVSLERIDILDGDVLVVLTNGADVDDIVGWENLPAVETGAVAVLDQSQAMALNTPSPLAIPYGLDAIRPALEAAAGAG